MNSHSLIITEEGYGELPDDLRKRIEVIDGNVVFCQSATPEHGDVARRLANRLEALKPDESCSRVSSDIDVYLAEHLDKGGKFSFRRPDVTVYKCIPRGTKVRTPDALMVVEVVSPGSGYTDTVDKLAEYAFEGIPIYLIVFLDGDLYVKMIQEFRLDWASRTYRLAETHTEVLSLDQPFPVSIPFSQLDD